MKNPGPLLFKDTTNYINLNPEPVKLISNKMDIFLECLHCFENEGTSTESKKNIIDFKGNCYYYSMDDFQ